MALTKPKYITEYPTARTVLQVLLILSLFASTFLIIMGICMREDVLWIWGIAGLIGAPLQCFFLDVFLDISDRVRQTRDEVEGLREEMKQLRAGSSTAVPAPKANSGTMRYNAKTHEYEAV